MLFDQVKLRIMEPLQYIDLFCRHFGKENEELIIPDILSKVAFIIRNGLINTKDKPELKDQVLE